MATTIEELTVKITADMGQLQRELRRAQQQSERATGRMRRAFVDFGKRVGSAASSVINFRTALVAAAGAAGMGVLIRSSVNAADSVGKVADKVGLSTDALQELRFAADQAGVAQNTLDMAMQRFSRRVGEAAQDTGELKDTLQQYGIEVSNSDGSTRTLESVLGDLANAMQNATSDSERLRIAFKAFDSEGAALVNLLREGSVSLDEMRRQAREFGVVLNESLVREAEVASDELEAMDRQIKANITRFSIEFTPVLVAASELLVGFADAAVRAKDAMREFLLSLPSGSLGDFGLNEPTAQTADERNIVSDRRQREAQALRDQIRALDDQIADLETPDNQQQVRPLAFIEKLKEDRLDLELQLEAYEDVIADIVSAVDGMTGSLNEAADAQERVFDIPSRLPRFPGAGAGDEDSTDAPSFQGTRGSFAPTVPGLEGPDVFDAASAPEVEAVRAMSAEMDGPLRDAAQALVDDMRRDLRSPFEIATEEMQRWRDLMATGATDITNNDLQRIQDKINDDLASALNETGDVTQRVTAEMSRGFERVAQSGVGRLISSLGRAELSFESLGQIALSILSDIANMFAQIGVQSAFQSGGGGGGFLQGLFGIGASAASSAAGGVGGLSFAGGFDEGGVIGPGQFGVVGETRPEIAIHRPAGTEIVPMRPSASSMSSTGGSVPSVTLQQSFDFRGADAGVELRVRKMLDQDRPRTIAMATQEVRKLTLQGGSFARDMGKR
jgi:hypothetical protein